MPGNIRQPAVAGMFYDWDGKTLRKTLDSLFSKTRKGPEYEAVISPHAGYTYSGRTAALAISSLKPGKRFIILGPNHTGLGREFSIMASGSWATPLGRVPVDTGIARALEKHGLTEDDELAHSREHSIEVQLPFLQHRFGPDITFLPLAIMGFGYTAAFLEHCRRLGSCLAGISRKYDARIIASSDFSHFISWEAARERDHRAIEKIKDLDLEGFFRVLHETHASICGYAPIAVLMAAAGELGWKKVEALDYTSSGETTGDMGEVVAYAAIGFR
jgi:AmmeMemoRadiSam system protein B